MEALDPHIIRLIFGYLNDRDLKNVITLNKWIHNRVCNKYFWLKRFKDKFGLSFRAVNKYKKNGTYCGYYYNILTEMGTYQSQELLSLACRTGREDVAKIALIRGADLSLNDHNAFKTACKYGNLAVVKLLASEGANIHIDQEEAFRWACHNGHDNIVRFLIENETDIHVYQDRSLREASAEGHYDVVKLLLNNGANIYALGDYSLRLATYNNHLHIMELLLDRGSNAEAGLAWAIQTGNVPALKLLLRYPIDIEAIRGHLHLTEYVDINTEEIKQSLMDTITLNLKKTLPEVQ